MENSTKALVGIAAAVVIGGVVLTAREVFATPGNGNGGDTGEDPKSCEDFILDQTINIQSITPKIQADQNIWNFNVVYENRSCVSQSFAAIMQVFDKDGGPIGIVVRNITVRPGFPKIIFWDYNFLPKDREQGKNKVEFFCWQSFNFPAPVSKLKTVTI